MKAISYFHDDVDTTDKDNEECVRWLMMKYGLIMKKEVTQGTFTTKKVKTLPEDAIASSLEAESASAPKKD